MTLGRSSLILSKYLFPYGAQNLRSKLTIFNDFLSKLASTIECESIIATAEFLCQIDKLSELLNKFLEYSMLTLDSTAARHS